MGFSAKDHPLFRLDSSSNTPVKLQFAQTISSAHVRRGDRLNFVVVGEVAVGGCTLISAGTVAAGSVIGVRKRRYLGIGGKMINELDLVELTNGESVGVAWD